MKAAVVLYESPFRIIKLLEDIAEIDKERYICIGREMTKVHEEYIRGAAEDVLARLAGRDGTIGEFAVYIAGNYSV